MVVNNVGRLYPPHRYEPVEVIIGSDLSKIPMHAKGRACLASPGKLTHPFGYRFRVQPMISGYEYYTNCKSREMHSFGDPDAQLINTTPLDVR